MCVGVSQTTDGGGVKRRGLDPTVDFIPVPPTQHYSRGGIRTDHQSPWRRDLFARGEVACRDRQGFNRLGGNSVAETVVAGMLVREYVADFRPAGGSGPDLQRPGPGFPPPSGSMSLLGCHDVCPKGLSLQTQIAYLRRAMVRQGLRGQPICLD